MSITKHTTRVLSKAARKGRDPSLARLVQWGMDRRRMSQRDLASAAGLNQSIVSRIISGRRHVITAETAEKLGVVIGVRWEAVLQAARTSRALYSIGAPVGVKSK